AQMRKLIAWTVWNPTTRRPKRSGWIDERLIDRLVFDPATERLLIGEAAALRTDEIGEDGHLRPIPQEVLDAERAAKLAAIEPTEAELVIEALKKKHGLTAADLADARQDIQARRQAGTGKGS